jgi:hypothetical protein
MAHPAAALTMLVANSIGHSDFVVVGTAAGDVGVSPRAKPMTGWPLKRMFVTINLLAGVFEFQGEARSSEP